MSISASGPTLTIADLIAMPDDGIDRDLIRGELRETLATPHTRLHSGTLARVGHYLLNWLFESDLRGGEVYCGNVGVRLSQSPETSVGVDVAYYSPEAMTRTPRQPWCEGPPTLAVEIISPSDKHENLVEKVELYLEFGVPVVWVIDPDFEQISIHRPAQPVVTLNVKQTLEGHPELPNFSVPVSKLFSWWD